MPLVKEILGTDEIPSDYCSSSCCNIESFAQTDIACIATDTCNTDTNMCVNGINIDLYRCDLGRPFFTKGIKSFITTHIQQT